MITRAFAFLCRFGPLKRLLWRHWYQFLADRYQVREWQVMNYGYAPIPETTPMLLDAEDEPERYGLQLYDRVTGCVPWEGSEVLEVGCGRGGGAAFLHRTRRPATMTAVDFSAKAVALCRERYTGTGLTFRPGDAENLPFPDESFDIVVNIESSHCYGSMEAFLDGVQRVLKPGGSFLHADFRDREAVECWREQLRGTGMNVEHEWNITPNVLAALDEDNDRKLALMRKLLPERLLGPFRDFAAVRGSLVYEHFRTGRMEYWQFHLRKKQKTPA